MPPKKAQAARAVAKKDKNTVSRKIEGQSKDKPTEAPESKDTDRQPTTNGRAESNTSKKRKSPGSESKEKQPAKVSKQGSRLSSRTKASSNASGPSLRQILNFMLSKEALPYCYPEDDLEAKQAKKYSTTSPAAFTPFEHLLTASLLSKPLSHKLGMRSTRTLLNAPYGFNDPAAIVKAGYDRVYQSLEDAKTQHRQKTANYIFDMAQAFEDGEALGFLKEMVNEKGPQGVIHQIGKTVTGIGKTGAEIFCRRIQAVGGWGDAVWPFADGRALEALKQLGVEVKDASELQEMVETMVDFDKVGGMGLDKVQDMDVEQQVQVEYVVLLERAVGATLEGSVEKVKKMAAGAVAD